MKPQGAFRFWLPEDTIQLPDRRIILAEKPSIIIPNLVTAVGAQAYLKGIFQNVAPTTTWYVGLCNQVITAASVLSDISTEPTVTNGYARQSLARSAVGWPTVTTVNGRDLIRSATVTFTASGGAFSAGITRAFLCSVSSGTAGTLFAVSGALSAALTLQDGQSFALQYESYLFS